MSVRLLVKQRSEAGGADKASEVLIDEGVITLGRDPDCEVVLALPAVSRHHARITQDAALYFIEDLGSAFGTRVNGQRLPKNEKRLLRNGDTIEIAQFDLSFDRVAEKGAENTAMVARKAVKEVVRGLQSGGQKTYFRVMNGPKEGQRIELQDGQDLVVGREEGADLIFKDDLVSRKHAKIRRDWSGTHVEDLGSRNGIKVNKKRVPRATLRDRDEEIGGIRLLYLDPSEVRESAILLEEGDSTIFPPPKEAAASAEEESEASESEASEADDSEVDEEPSGDEDEEPQEDEDQAEEGSTAEAPEGEDGDEEEGNAPGGFAKLMGGRPEIVPIVVIGTVALLALIVVIALFAGA